MSPVGRIESKLTELVAPICEEMGFELVGVRYLIQRGMATVQVFIDKERVDGEEGSGVDVEDCATVSRRLSAFLDEDESVIRGKYSLEVSSPGLERPLMRPEHYERFTGREARVKTSVPIEGQRNFKGVIRGFADGSIILEEDGKEKAIPFEDVVKANLIPRH
jgi:ribosome maturation factor RimP